jgi:hypothetical protein
MFRGHRAISIRVRPSQLRRSRSGLAAFRNGGPGESALLDQRSVGYVRECHGRGRLPTYPQSGLTVGAPGPIQAGPANHRSPISGSYEPGVVVDSGTRSNLMDQTGLELPIRRVRTLEVSRMARRIRA